MNSRRVLFIGGEMDGKVMDVDAELRVIEVPCALPIYDLYQPKDDVPTSVPFRTETYRVHPIVGDSGEVSPSIAMLEARGCDFASIWSALTSGYANKENR